MTQKLKPATRLSVVFILVVVLSGSILTWFSINNISNQKVLTEKPKYDKNTSFSSVETKSVQEVEIEKKSATSEIKGEILSLSEKALNIKFESGKSEWIPLTVIHSRYAPDIGITQDFVIDTWILKRHNLI